ncbi:MAG: phosphopyruvate hydratase [Candidatus Colwellbacteria bacterium CG10_big_fil_rev_8_21_14_0_10_41_28]|uniref:Enolase n=1 Tax=Candidatus Colwellbacteria bacterium CG10_big_fil_rev_8_21_14_0_10_41_28 TaxID=1974539 RepID=A0A2H0VHZ0_9BACT|nr:MAG: phosphopyruvate hydratase [Candidatus Colwellbacteria bacterium CG10_big_fil_rev_8_21_14_0_10_41_28]
MPKVDSISAEKILNSRGDWTIKVNVVSDKGNQESFSVPEGKSRGSMEARIINPDKAIDLINKKIAKEFRGFDFTDQSRVDARLIELDGTKNKSNLGSNTILGVSFALARLAAKEEGVPFWKYISKLSKAKVSDKKPQIFANMINGGVHADNNLDIQEFLLLTKNSTFRKSVEKIVKVFQQIKLDLENTTSIAVGDEGGFAVSFRTDGAAIKYLHSFAKKNNLGVGIDAAANNLNWINLRSKMFYKRIHNKFGVSYIEDPFRENEARHFSKLVSKFGKSLSVSGDDLTVTSSSLIEEAHQMSAINAVIIKPNQIGTLTEALEAVKLARKYEYQIIASHRSGETNDTSIVDFAVGIAADGIKIGAPNRGERVAKYNRLLEIEGELKGRR